MTFSDLCRDGFALAAAVSSDPGAKRAQAGLDEAGRAVLCAHAERIAALPRVERRRWVAALLAPPALDTTALGDAPARALALLAPNAPRNVGTAWLAHAGLPRAGYRPAAGLLPLLRRLASGPEEGR